MAAPALALLAPLPSQLVTFNGPVPGLLGGARWKTGRGARKPPAVRSLAAVEVGEAAAAVEGVEEYDAIVVGSGMGGLVAATQLAAQGARVLVVEKYAIPGGSSGFYERNGFTFDVGPSVMFGFSDK